MKKRRKQLLIIGLLVTGVLLMAGCQQDHEKDNSEANTVEKSDVVEVEETEVKIDTPSLEKEANEPITFLYKETERQYYLHIPENVKTDAPLVFVLHGYTSNALDAINSFGMNEVADANGFVVCYPQGSLDASEKPHWNANLNISETDDVGFLIALAKDLQTTYDLDEDGTFACGMSNGGFMSYTLGLEASDVFKAIGSVVGTMSYTDWTNRESGSPISVIQISAVDDQVVAYIGMYKDVNGWGGAPSHDEINNFWKTYNGCDVSEVLQVSDTITGYRDSNSDSGIKVWYYVFQSLKHKWPTKLDGLQAAELVWEFFESEL